jgi:hypothetical protein
VGSHHLAFVLHEHDLRKSCNATVKGFRSLIRGVIDTTFFLYRLVMFDSYGRFSTKEPGDPRVA